MKSGRFIRGGLRAFSLVEVTIALGIVTFAIIPLFGLLAIGLNTNRSNNDRSIRAQIVSWAQGDVRWRTVAYSASFDESGVLTINSQGDYLVNITNRIISLPGGSQPIAAWRVIIRHKPGGNQVIEDKTVWGSL